MILAMFWENPAVVGVIIAIPATAAAVLGYRRSLPVDKAVKQVGEMAGHIGLITALQADNLVLRGEYAALQEDNKVLRGELTALRNEVAALRRDQEREIAVLHSENEALKVENQKLKVRISELEKANGP